MNLYIKTRKNEDCYVADFAGNKDIEALCVALDISGESKISEHDAVYLLRLKFFDLVENMTSLRAKLRDEKIKIVKGE